METRSEQADAPADDDDDAAWVSAQT